MAELQAIMMQLASAQEQVATLSMAIDTVRAEASNAVRELREGLAAEQRRTESLQSFLAAGGRSEPKVWNLVSSKEFAGGRFTGARGENFKAWSKLVRIYCNTQKTGFKRVLEDIDLNEEVEVNQRVFEGWSWEHADVANSKLHDFLMTHCGDDALRIVEAYPDRGFEAWRRLKKRYNPTGGRFELDKMNKMLARRQCKDLSDLPAAIDISSEI